MSTDLKLLAVFAHPDDETLGAGSTLARYAAEGTEVHLVTATRGERGWQGNPADNPGMDVLGELRTRELYEAACVLGIRDVAFLDYVDGNLDQADPAEATGKIVSHLRRVRPQVVVTFGPDGSYGHPDHIAISQLTTAAVVCAADGSYADSSRLPAHRVAKLYYMVDSKRDLDAFVPLLGDIVMPVDGVERHLVGWEEWAITTRI
ncbi:MAG TPA: PIG-L family deacetylase, partial [Herpetosiphonaceae bacterium]|nr:PIG-L family deacetylase [Herpetosiphonaceae bacterium]